MKLTSLIESNTQDQITIVQYNVLAEVYCTASRYNYCPEWALKWDYRKWNIIHEIAEYKPDIICLQEVDKFEFFDEELQSRGYRGAFRKRPNGMADGVALFYKIERFKLLDAHSVDYNKIQTVDNSNFSGQIRYQKNNVALFTLLETIVGVNEKPTRFCVATTHTYWDPNFSDVKVRQSHMLLKKLEQYLKYKANMNTPVIITGDFNSLPTSAVYELYANGSVAGNHSDMRNYTQLKNFTHNFKLKSAYSYLKEPLTNLTPWFKGTLDYIWYSEGFDLVSLFDMVPEDSIKREVGIVGLPTPTWPSDHAALCCTVQFKQSKTSL